MKGFPREYMLLVEVHSNKASNQHGIINDLGSISPETDSGKGFNLK